MTWDKVDLERGLVEISGEVKNRYRNRVIPVCRRVLEALLRSRSAKIQAVNGQVVPLYWETYSKRTSKAVKRFNANLDWQTKDLRNCLLQFALRRGILSDVWEQYVGHKPRTVTGLHYINRLATVSRGQHAELDRRMALFREQVLEPVERKIAEDAAGKGNIRQHGS